VRLPGWFAAGGRDPSCWPPPAALAASRALTAALQNGSLQRYLLLLVLMALAAGAWPFWQAAPRQPPSAAPATAWTPSQRWWAVGIAATLGTVLAWRQRLLAVVLMGATGLVVCLVFVWFSAPDLALTQLLVEVATVVLMMLALRWLPAQSPPLATSRALAQGLARRRAGRGRGLGVAALVWQVLALPSASIATTSCRPRARWAAAPTRST
jgi:multicomponent K+:H+ antiporter subunit A